MTQHLEECEERYKVFIEDAEQYGYIHPALAEHFKGYVKSQRAQQHNKTVMECLKVVERKGLVSLTGFPNGLNQLAMDICNTKLKEVEQAIKSLLK